MNELILDDDPTSYKEAIESEYSSEWLNDMEDEMKSMSTNEVWDLIEIPKGAKTVDCKWVYKTKCDSKGNIERVKARLVSKGFTHRGKALIIMKSFCISPLKTQSESL